MKRIGSWSFFINNNEFPTIKFSSNKQGREENISAINIVKFFLKAAKLLKLFQYNWNIEQINKYGYFRTSNSEVVGTI